MLALSVRLMCPFFACFLSAVLKLAGWPKNVIIARCSQWVSNDIAVLSPSLSHSTADDKLSEAEILTILANVKSCL